MPTCRTFNLYLTNPKSKAMASKKRKCPTDLEEKFQQDMLKMLKKGTKSDVVFNTKGGGQITAHKDILAARSQYFNTLFRGDQFIEGQVKTIDMKHIEKKVMQTLIDYLFSGKIDYTKLKLDQLLSLMELFKLYLLNDEYKAAKNHVQGKVNQFPIVDVNNSLALVKLHFEDLYPTFVARIHRDLPTIVPATVQHKPCPMCPQEDKEKKVDDPKTPEAKALTKHPYEVFKEILFASNASVDFATKIRVFNLWYGTNEGKLKAKDLKDVFKDYRELVDREVARQPDTGAQGLKFCGHGGHGQHYYY